MSSPENPAEVPCPGCGRRYRQEEVQGGRTFTCTCGARVVGEPVPRPQGPGPPRFFADAMLGSLARWLRTLGFDTLYEEHVTDEELVARAVAEERVVLTRDRRLPLEWRVEGCLLLESEDTAAQLEQVVRTLGLTGPARMFGRCRICNTALAEASASDVVGRVPEGVLERYEAFLACAGCGRVYWEGSHARRMRRVVAEVFGR